MTKAREAMTKAREAMTTPLPPVGGLLLRSALTLGRAGRADWPEAGLAQAFETAIAPGWLAAYQAFFGGFSSAVPLTALFPLAQRAHLALMLDGRFPYAVPGLVHGSESLIVEGPVAPDAPLVLAASVQPVPDAPGRLALEVAFSQGGARVATSQSVYVARRGGAKGPRADERMAPEPIADARLEAWTLGADEGRRYAAVSGDYNPIHLSPWLAKGFGFPRAILHGMDAAARVVASVERGTGAPVRAIAVRFRRPVFLPATPMLSWSPTAGRFWLEGADGVRHLEGSFTSG